MTGLNDPVAAASWLRSPQAIRGRAGVILDAGRAGDLAHFAIREERLEDAAELVVETIRDNYPGLEIPYHSRWRHFTAGGIDRWAALAAGLRGESREEIARIRFDLTVTSVLLDAGAGSDWRYRAPGGDGVFVRSEGLAVASLHLFASGAFSTRPGSPLEADAAGLGAMTAERLAEAFQAGPDNPLVGLEGRAALLQRLSGALRASPEIFGSESPRVGKLFDHLKASARDNRVPAAAILEAVLVCFGAIWPGRIELGGVNLGDTWRHPAAASDDLTDGLVPFHKLSQWLAYSLVEPLEEAGLDVTGLDELTGLPEYRNGGLLVDCGVLEPKHSAVLGEAHGVESEIVVEWRALTVALLDELARRVRARLEKSAAELPLAKILEGGTWSAGRRIARERRADGSPPIKVVSDGTVF
ncbi:MAG: URC4/urg3 family protein [Kiloniellales bacterium]